MAKVEANIYIGEGGDYIGVVAIDGVVEIRHNGSFDLNAVNAVSVIANTCSALSTGKNIGAYWNPTITEEREEEIVKCRWLRSGKLQLISETPERKCNHATLVGDAVARGRTFTCTRRVYRQLPAKRDVKRRVKG